MGKAEDCRKIERLYVRNIAYTVAHGLELEFSKEHILSKIDEQDRFWREALELSQCSTDPDITKTVTNMKNVITKLVV